MDLFGTAGIRGSAETRVTPELALAVGRAVAAEVRRAAEEGTRPDEVVLARDGRVTGPAIAAAMESGLASGGVRVLRAGRLPTPALAHASQGRYGVMLTASHNPPTDNGIKLFRDGSEFDREAERAVENASRARSPGGVGRVDRDGARRHPRRLPRRGPRVRGGVRGRSRRPPDRGRLRERDVRARDADCPARAGRRGRYTQREHRRPLPRAREQADPESLRDLRAFIADANEGVAAPGRPGAEIDAEGFAFGIGHDGDSDRIVIIDADGDVVHEDTRRAARRAVHPRATPPTRWS